MKIIDSKVWDYGNWLYDFIIINLLWIIFSIPIITVGPATNAGLKSIKELEKNRSQRIFRVFIINFKDKFIAYGLVVNSYIGIIISSVLFSIHNFYLGNIVFTSIGIFIIFECMIALSVLFTLEYYNPIDLMINSLIYGNKNILKALISIVLCIISLFICMNIPILMPISISICMFISYKIIV